jgi:hypothetical protein
MEPAAQLCKKWQAHTGAHRLMLYSRRGTCSLRPRWPGTCIICKSEASWYCLHTAAASTCCLCKPAVLCKGLKREDRVAMDDVL